MALLKVYISGVQYQAANTYQIREQVGQTSSVNLEVTLRSLSGGADNPIPQSWQRLQIKDNLDDVVWTGIIQAVDSPQWSSGYELKYKIVAQDLTCVFDFRYVNEAFQNKTATEIIDSIFDDYLDEENFTKGTISDFDYTYEVYTAAGLTLRKVFNEIGDAVGAAAYIDKDGVFTFRSQEDLPEVTPPIQITKLQDKEVGRGLVTVQKLTGANTETSTITEAVQWSDDDQRTFSVGYQISDIASISINGTPYDVGVKGVDEGNTDTTFLYKYGEQLVTVNENATVKPTAGDSVGILYTGFFSVEINSENEPLKSTIAALSGLSGKIENLKVDTSITNYADGEQQANSLLEINSVREHTVSCEYRSDSLDYSAMLNVWDLTAYSGYGFLGKYVIVERGITDYGELLSISVKLKNKNFYSRYGTVLDKNDRQINNLSIRVDDVVIKTSIATETCDCSEEYEINQGPTMFYPASGSNLYNPSSMSGFYPTY